MEEIKYVQIEKEPEPETNLEQVLDNLEVVEERKVVQKVEVEEEKEKVEVDKAKVVEEESDEQNELDKEESEEQKELDKEESEEQKEFDKEESKEQKEFEEQKELEKVGFDEHKELEEVYLKELEEQKGITRQTESLLLVIRATLKIQAAFRHHLVWIILMSSFLSPLCNINACYVDVRLYYGYEPTLDEFLPTLWILITVQHYDIIIDLAILSANNIDFFPHNYFSIFSARSMFIFLILTFGSSN